MDKLITLLDEVITGEIVLENKANIYIRVHPTHSPQVQEELELAKAVYGEEYVEQYLNQPQMLIVPKSDLKVIIKAPRYNTPDHVLD